MVSMVFRRKKHKNTAEESIDFHALVLEQLEHMCEEGQILDDAFVLEAQDIYIYADVISVEHNVAQIVFQLHHEWLDDAILESVAASGSNAQGRLHWHVRIFTGIPCSCICGLCRERRRKLFSALPSFVITFRCTGMRYTVSESGKV